MFGGAQSLSTSSFRSSICCFASCSARDELLVLALGVADLLAQKRRASAQRVVLGEHAIEAAAELGGVAAEEAQRVAQILGLFLQRARRAALALGLFAIRADFRAIRMQQRRARTRVRSGTESNSLIATSPGYAARNTRSANASELQGMCRTGPRLQQ